MVWVLGLLLLLSQVCGEENMNGDVYKIANPPSGQKTFSTRYGDNPKNEYFDLYSHEIKSTYGEVFWTMMPPVALPEAPHP